jgi:hypothetical protein
MFKRASVRLVAVAVVLFVMGMSGTAAGQQAVTASSPVLGQAAIERSRAVQAELARIEANKEAFIDELFGRWAPYLDPTVYDLWGSPKPIAMAATPWRLLGASMASDFESGARVLRGIVGPGWYVSAYIEGREPVVGAGTAQTGVGASGVGAAAIGGGMESLVFTPISPCRIVDTRGTGARTGILTAGSTRVFDLSADGLAEGQGGDTVCPGLPTYQHKAWAVNITVFGYSALGHLTVWPYTYSKPSASFLNFFTTAYAVANAGAVTGCLGCLNSINVSVAAATHVIIDVMGYYEEATGFAGGALTDFAGTTESGIAPGGSAILLGGTCPAGTKFVSGAFDSDSGTGSLVAAEQYLVGGDTWRQVVRNIHATVTFSATAYTRCIDVQ